MYGVVYGSMIIFIVWGGGEDVWSGYVATIANIMRIDSTPCNLVVTSCYLLLLSDNFL